MGFLQNIFRKRTVPPPTASSASDDYLWLIDGMQQKGACISACEALRQSSPDRLSKEGICGIEEALACAIDVSEFTQKWTPDNVERYVPKFNADVVYGAIYGDIVGSRYEFGSRRINKKDFSLPVFGDDNPKYRFTDDTVLTIATMETLAQDFHILQASENIVDSEHIFGHTTLLGGMKDEFARYYIQYGKRYPTAGYGSAFTEWLANMDMQLNNCIGYGSRGNGSAMRISPVGALGLPYEDTVRLAIESVACTHDHFEGIKGAVVTAVSVWMACAGASKNEIFAYMRKVYDQPGIGVFHDYTVSEAQKQQVYQVECQFSVPASIIAIAQAESFKDGILTAMTVGRDTDTNACIAGGILGALYGVPNDVKQLVRTKLNPSQKYILNLFKHIQ